MGPWSDSKATRNLLTHHDWTIDDTILHRIASPSTTSPR